MLQLSPAAIHRIRTKAAVSQAVFAAHMNVTTGVVSKWERGEKQPRGISAQTNTFFHDLPAHRKPSAWFRRPRKAIALSPQSKDLGQLVHPFE